MSEFVWEAENNDSDAILLLSDKQEQEEGFDLKEWYRKKGFREIVETPTGYLMLKELREKSI